MNIIILVNKRGKLFKRDKFNDYKKRLSKIISPNINIKITNSYNYTYYVENENIFNLKEKK